MATRAVLQTFERYQKERVAFVSAVAEMAKSPQVLLSAQSPARAHALLQWVVDTVLARQPYLNTDFVCCLPRAEHRGSAASRCHGSAAASAAGQCAKVGAQYML